MGLLAWEECTTWTCVCDFCINWGSRKYSTW